MRENTRRK